MNISQRYTLGKTERLKSRKLIEQVFKQGKAFSIFPFRVIYLLKVLDTNAVLPITNQPIRNTSDHLQTGFTVSTKYFKKAVDRNRIKRLMREAYRLQKNELQKIVVEKNIHLAIFFIYTGNELPDYTTIFDKTAAVLKRVQKNCNEQTKADS